MTCAKFRPDWINKIKWKKNGFLQNSNYDVGLYVLTVHSSLGDWGSLLVGYYITHLIIIIKSELSTFPLVVIFFHNCVLQVVIPSSWEIWVLLLLLLCSLTMCTNNWAHYDPMVVYIFLHITLPHYHHYADVSESTELLKCLSGTFCQVCV